MVLLNSFSGFGRAVFHGVIGITVHSAWYGSLSAYYLLLCVMRLLSVSYAKQIYTKKERGASRKKRELKVYRNCGMLLPVSFKSPPEKQYSYARQRLQLRLCGF